MLKNRQLITIHQKLSPHLVQSQLLLAIPAVALEQEIKLQIESNPLLEEVAEAEQEDEVIEAPESNEEIYEKDDELEKISEHEDSYELDDWYDYSDLDFEGYKSPYEYEREKSYASENKADYLIDKSAKAKETPLEQLYRAGLTEKEVFIGEDILGSLDDDGYLRDSIDDVRNDLCKEHRQEFTNEEIEKVLKIIQKFDPVGIASRNLQECLSVQVEELEIDEGTKRLCLKMINEHFEDFRLRHYEKLSKLLNVSIDRVSGLFEVIHKLDPVPGNIESLPERNYIYPDFIVRSSASCPFGKGEIIVELTGDYSPSLKINRRYIEMLRSKKSSKEAREFLKNKLEAAKWFMNSIVSRRETLLKVMNAIVSRQKEFFLSGGSNLKPMYEKDIAEDIGMDISTVSRAVRNKYVQTDFGMFELKYFFSNPIQTESGDDVSSKIVKEKIKELIDNEDKTRPLSDDKITKLMNEAGFTIARRTVAKYREAMKIPKAHLRRRIQ